MLKFLLLIFLFFASLVAAVPVCPGAFNKPSSAPFVSWYPNDFSGSGAPLFPDNYDCLYQINVPQGWSARINITLDAKVSSTVAPLLVTDHLNVTEEVFSTDDDFEFFFFAGNGGQLKLSTGTGKVRFGFKIDWVQYGPFSPSQIQVNSTATLPSTATISASSSIVITAETRVSLTAVIENYNFYWMLLRGVLVFDGPDWNSPCIGTAYQMWKRQVQYVSTGRQMTVQFLNRQTYYTPFFILQDYKNTEGIVQFQGVTCGSGSYCGVYSMDASNGPVAVQTLYSSNYAEPDILTDVSGMGTLEVYMGGVTKSRTNLMTMYNAQTSANYLPQEFRYPIKTYLLTMGQASINLTRDTDELGNTKGFGRKGFIASTFYTQLEKGQHAYGEILAPVGSTDAKFKLRVTYADMSGNAVMWIEGVKNGEVVFEKDFNSTQLPDTRYDMIVNGDSFNMYYDSMGTATRGVYMKFEVARP